jgi:hypothetical protein
MIEFTDNFSQAAVAETCSAFSDLLKLSLELTPQIFERSLDALGHITEPAEVNALMFICKTVFYVCMRGMVDHLPKEIGFCRFATNTVLKMVNSI